MQTNKQSKLRWLVATFLVVALLLGALAISALAMGQTAASASGVERALASNPVQQSGQLQPEGLQDALALVDAHESVLNGIYEDVVPSVVHIRVVQNVDAGLSTIPGLPDDHEDFQAQGEGSGFVWDQEGHIVTNNHVVDNAEQVRVVFSDGTDVEAEVLGTDPNADLAVIKVDVPASLLIPVQLGDSGEVKVGQMAVALGNPFGLENTMTYGIVSAVGRTISSGLSQFSIPEVIQTDAPINPGNSGGPLLDKRGQVIGINTQIVSRSGSNSGIGFAVPINIAKRVVPDLIENGDFEYAWLGISGQTLSAVLAEAMDLPAETRGAMVMAVAEDGPAAEAGLRGSDDTAEMGGVDVPVGGDVIIAIDGEAITGMDDLIAYLADNTSPGDEVELTILRNGSERTVEVTLGTRPS